MNDLSDLPPRSHNNPPEILPALPPTKSDEEIAAAFAAAKAEAPQGDEPKPYDEAAHHALAMSVMAFCDACGAWKDLKQISTAAQSERLTDFVTGARALFKKVDEQRTSDKSVHDARAAAVQTAYKTLLDKLKRVGEDMKEMQSDWLTRENERIAAAKAEAAAKAAAEREAAEKEAAEAERRNDVSGAVEAEARLKAAEKDAKAAARTTTAKAGSATGGGRSMSLRTVYECEIESINHAFAAFRTAPEVADALVRLANAEVRSQAGEKVAPVGFKLITKQVAA